MNARENARRFIPTLNQTLNQVCPGAKSWLVPDPSYGGYPALIVISHDGRRIPVTLFIESKTPLCPKELANKLAERFRAPPKQR